MDQDISASSTNFSPPQLPSTSQQNSFSTSIRKFNNRKLFFIILLLIFVSTILGISILAYQLKFQTKISKPTAIVPPPTTEAQEQNIYEGWNTYSSPLFGFSFKYPKYLKVFEEQRNDRVLLSLDPDEKQFSSQEKIASLSSKFSQNITSDKEKFKKEIIDELYKIFDPNIYGPFIEVEVSKRYSIYLEHAFDNLSGEQKTLTINNIQALQKSGDIVLFKESTISPQIRRNRTVTVFFKDEYGYKFTYTSHPQRADYYPVYQDIINSFQFIERLPTPTSPYQDKNLPIHNPQPTFPLENLRNWESFLKLADEKAITWATDARLHEVEVDIYKDASIPIKLTFHYVSDAKSQMTTFIVRPDQVEEGQLIVITDPEALVTLDRQSPYFSPYESIIRALKTISPYEEQNISDISSTFDNYNHNPASYDLEPISFTGWLVAAYKKNVSEPIRILVDIKTGNVIYKK